MGVNSISAFLCWDAHPDLSELWFLRYKVVVGQHATVVPDTKCGSGTTGAIPQPLTLVGLLSEILLEGTCWGLILTTLWPP